MQCVMCGTDAEYIINGGLPLCGECFNPDDPDVEELMADGLEYEEISNDTEVEKDDYYWKTRRQSNSRG